MNKEKVMIDPLKLAGVVEGYYLSGASLLPPEGVSKVCVLIPAVVEAFEFLSPRYGRAGTARIFLEFLTRHFDLLEVEDHEVVVEALKAAQEFPDLPFTTLLAGIKGRKMGLEAVWR